MKQTINYILLSLVTFGMFLAICFAFSSCSTEKAGYGKSGCGSYDGWNSHTKYRINGRN